MLAAFTRTSKRIGVMHLADWLQGANFGIPRDDMPMRTVYNPKTHQHEEIPLAQFQQLLRQGKIEEMATQSPYDGHPQRVYRLV